MTINLDLIGEQMLIEASRIEREKRGYDYAVLDKYFKFERCIGDQDIHHNTK